MNVEGPDGKVIEFPDDMPQEQIKVAMQRHYGAPVLKRTMRLGDLPGLKQINEFGKGMVQGGTETVKSIPQIPGAIAGAMRHPIEQGPALLQGMIPAPETLKYILGAVGGDPTGVTPPSASTMGREAGSLVTSQLLGEAVPRIAKGAARSIVRDLPGAQVELHSLAIPRAREVPEAIRPTAGAVKQAYDDLAALGNPTLHMGEFRRVASDILAQEEKLANPDAGMIRTLTNYLKDSENGWGFEKVKTEAEHLGADIGQISTNRGATTTGTPQGPNRIYDAKLRRLLDAMHDDVDAAKPHVHGSYEAGTRPTRPGTPPEIPGAGPNTDMLRTGGAGAAQPTEQTVAVADQWKRATRLARRDFAANGLARMIEKGITVTGDQHSSLNVNPVIKELERARALAKIDKKAKLFVGSLEPGELDQMISTLKDIGKNLPRIPPMSGAITGSSQRVMRGVVGAGLGSVAGEMLGGNLGGQLGAMGGVVAPEIIAQAMMSDSGRALVRTAMKIDPTVGPVFRNTLAAFLRTQSNPAHTDSSLLPAPQPAPTHAPQPTPQQLEAAKPQQRDDQVDAVGR